MEAIKLALIDLLRAVFWHLFNKWKAENKEIVSKFEEYIGDLGIENAGTREDFGGGGNGEKKYTGQELYKLRYSNKTYDQTEFKDIVGTVGCFGYGNLNNASMNLGVELSEGERQTFAKNITETRGYNPTWGGYFSEGADVVNNLLDSKGIDYDRYYFIVNYSTLLHVIDKGYTVAMPINISQTLLNGLRDDGNLTEDEIRGVTSFGHLMNIKKTEDGTIVLWIDNYPDSQPLNIFKVDNLEALVRSGKFMRTARFYCPKKDTYVSPIVGKIEEEVKENDNYDLAIKAGFINNVNPNGMATRKELGRVAYRVYEKAVKDVINHLEK